MILTRNFTFEEFIKSTTAKRNGIDNTPDEQSINNIKKLAFILQKIRDKYGKPIIIDSGYRCTELNTLVKGVKNSDHRFGAACDIKSLEDTQETNKELFDLIVDMIKNGEISLRQLINEYDYDWIHLSVNHPFNRQKNNEILNIK